MYRELQSICPKDDIYLKTPSKSNGPTNSCLESTVRSRDQSVRALEQIVRACGQIVRAEMIANSQQRRRHLRQTSLSFFLERASTSNFCCASNQNNPHILKYVSYDRSRLLQPYGKLFPWAPPVPLGNFYLLAPPPPRNFH